MNKFEYFFTLKFIDVCGYAQHKNKIEGIVLKRKIIAIPGIAVALGNMALLYHFFRDITAYKPYYSEAVCQNKIV